MVSAHSEWSLLWLHAGTKSALFPFVFSFVLLSLIPLTSVLYHHSTDMNMETQGKHIKKISIYGICHWQISMPFLFQPNICQNMLKEKVLYTLEWEICSICTNLMSLTFKGECVYQQWENSHIQIINKQALFACFPWRLLQIGLFKIWAEQV